jgi:hypothetical protein
MKIPHLIELIYASTVRKDCLRTFTFDLILLYINHFRERDTTAFEDLLEAVPDFGADLVVQNPMGQVCKTPWQDPETLAIIWIKHSDPSELHNATKQRDLAEFRLLI